MKHTNKTKFINLLIQNTKDNNINWLPINKIFRQKNLETINPNAFYLISQCEFHTYNSHKSFYTDLAFGNIYLIYETFESGRDGTETEGYNLYIQERDENDRFLDSQIQTLEYDDDILQDLSNAITEYFDRENRLAGRLLKLLKKEID